MESRFFIHQVVVLVCSLPRGVRRSQTVHWTAISDRINYQAIVLETMVYFLFAHYKVSLPPFTFVGETVTQQTVSADASSSPGIVKNRPQSMLTKTFYEILALLRILDQVSRARNLQITQRETVKRLFIL